MRFHNDDKNQKELSNLHVKLMSTWGNCITTATISEESSTWRFEKEGDEEKDASDSNEEKKEDNDDEDQTPRPSDNSQEATWRKSCEDLKFDDKTFLEKFNDAPGIHAFLFGCDSDGVVKVLTYAYVDCSGLLLQGGAVSVRSFHRFGMFIDLKVHSEQALVHLNTLIPLEPFVLNLDR